MDSNRKYGMATTSAGCRAQDFKPIENAFMAQETVFIPVSQPIPDDTALELRIALKTIIMWANELKADNALDEQYKNMIIKQAEQALNKLPRDGE